MRPGDCTRPGGLTQMVGNATRDFGVFGREVLASRLAAGVTRREMAKRLGISDGYLADLEHEKRGPLGAEHDAAIHREIGIPVRRLEVLRALARGTVDVSGLGEAELAHLVGAVAALRGGAATWKVFGDAARGEEIVRDNEDPPAPEPERRGAHAQFLDAALSRKPVRPGAERPTGGTT